MSTRIHMVVSDELLAAVDGVRGDVPRSAWLRRVIEREVVRAVEQALGDDVKRSLRSQDVATRSPAPAEQPADVDVILGKAAEGLEFNRGPRVRSSAAARPFRQGYGPNVENVRSSSQSKRDVRPVPKKGEK